MNLVPLEVEDRLAWNSFIAKEFPPVGAFLQTWEWGDFKEKLYGKVHHFAILKGSEWVACFNLEIHTLPLGFSYGYAPRGPVLKKELWDDEAKVAEVFDCITELLHSQFAELLFVRFEPAHEKLFPNYNRAPYQASEACLQPRLNQLIPLVSEKLFESFVADVRHDIRAADRAALTVLDTESLTEEQSKAFEAMKIDTKNRSQKNIFPSDIYFKNLLASFESKVGEQDKQSEQRTQAPTLRYFIASRDGKPVAIYLSVLFANTLTYLFGASYTGSISKRAPAYLHWKSMNYAKEHGFSYYDLGGVDADKWNGLTYFKKQFGGETVQYVGTVNAVLRPLLYKLYEWAKKYRRIA